MAKEVVTMLTTPRLLIRPVLPEDDEAIFAYRSDSEINRFLTQRPKTIEEVDELIARQPKQLNEPNTWFQLVLIERDSGQLIGDIGLHFLTAEAPKQQAEIGYTLHKNAHGKGYAQEALRAVIHYLIVDLNKHRIVASIDPENAASLRLVERLGFRKEAHFVKSLFLHGEWVDDVVYALLAEDWEETNESKN